MKKNTVNRSFWTFDGSNMWEAKQCQGNQPLAIGNEVGGSSGLQPTHALE